MTKNLVSDNVLYQELKKVIKEKKKNLQDPLIEILHAAQDLFGYLPKEVQLYVAEHLDVPVSEVYGVVSFYNFFSMTPRGKHVINVCMGTACYVKGADRLMKVFSDELGIELGETTKDGLFTLTDVRCVGACSLAPVFLIDEDTFGRIDKRDELLDILNKYRN